MTTKITKPQKKELGFFPTLVLALLCAGFVRSFFFEPFHIPSSSMKPNLLIGDYIFVAKYSYGYSRYSFPFGPNLFEGRFWQMEKPKRGDVVVFKLPSNPKINYVKRLIGLPGDKIQMRQSRLYINGEEVEKNSDGIFEDSDSALITKIPQFLEKIRDENGDEKIVKILDQFEGSPQDNTGIYEVPIGYYFMMGDNRDNSQDSRFLSEVGYVPQENLVGRATIIFCSTAKPLWQFWNWPSAIRFNRIFDKVS
jgi:signal peptidase I